MLQKYANAKINNDNNTAYTQLPAPIHSFHQPMKPVVLSSRDAIFVKHVLNTYGLLVLRQLSSVYSHDLHVEKENILEILNRKFSE